MSSIEFVQRGRALLDQGRYQDAVKVCRLGLLAHPTDADGRIILGSALMSLCRYDEVLAEMRVTLELEMGRAEALALKGEALLRKGDAEEAVEVLDEAKRAAPGDPAVAALLAEARRSGRESRSLRSLGDNATKNYPMPVSDYGSGGSGTVEVDPTLGMVQSSRSRPAMALGSEDSDIIELDAGDLILEESRASALPVGASRRAPLSAFDDEEATVVGDLDSSEEPTRHYGEPEQEPITYDGPTGSFDEPVAPAVVPEGWSMARGKRGHLEDFAGSTKVGTTPETPLGRSYERSSVVPVANPSPGRSEQRSSTAPATPVSIDELFPDDGSSGAKPMPRAEHGDMQMIRAGLGIAAAPRGPKAADDTTGITVAPATGDAPSRAAVEPERTPQKKRDKRAKQADRTSAVPRQGGSRSGLFLYGVLAVLVVAAGVFAGLKIRQIRLERQIEAARRAAIELARTDTYAGYRAARDTFARIAVVRDSPATRASLARVRAALAAEFGEGLADAEVAVDRLGNFENADAAVARAYLALAQGRVQEAATRADEVVDRYPQEGLGPYLRGRAALLAEQPGKAAEAFRAAMELGQRPLILVGLGEAETDRRRFAEAKSAFERAADLVPGHPAAVIGRAQVLARGAALPPPGDPETQLEALLAARARPDEAQPSAKQLAWAALTLAEVHLARGNPDGARAALESARELRPPGDLELAESLTELLMMVGDTEAARQEAERVLGKWPDRLSSRVVLANVALAASDPAQALAVLEAVEDLSTHPEALAARGRARLALGELAAATSDLDSALAENPALVPALIARARVDLARGQAAAAVKRLEEPYGDHPEIAELGLVYAAALRGVGDVRRARNLLETLVEQPSAGGAYLELARLERGEANFVEARQAYAQAIERLPNAIEARMEAAALALDTGDAAGAREAISKLVEEAPEDGRVLLEAARIMSVTGAAEAAKKLLERAEKLPSAPRWLIARERGRALLQSRMPSAAVVELERAAGLEPDDGASRLLLLDAFLATEDEVKARQTLAQLLKKFSGRSESQLAIGRVDLFLEDQKGALEAFGKALELMTTEHSPPRVVAGAHYWIGRAHYYAGALDKAVAAFAKASELDPAHAEAHLFAGLIALERKQWAAAAKAFEEVVELDAMSNPDAWFYLGEASLQSRKPSAAKRAFKRYVELQPTGELTREARDYLRRLR